MAKSSEIHEQGASSFSIGGIENELSSLTYEELSKLPRYANISGSDLLRMARRR